VPEPAESHPDGDDVRHLPILASDADPLDPAAEHPVLAAEARPLSERVASLPAPVLAAAGGFLAGIAAWVLLRVIRRSPDRVRVGRRRRGDKGLDVAATRSFLVDVHILNNKR
jgi:hypothetical protein